MYTRRRSGRWLHIGFQNTHGPHQLLSQIAKIFFVHDVEGTICGYRRIPTQVWRKASVQTTDRESLCNDNQKHMHLPWYPATCWLTNTEWTTLQNSGTSLKLIRGTEQCLMPSSAKCWKFASSPGLAACKYSDWFSISSIYFGIRKLPQAQHTHEQAEAILSAAAELTSEDDQPPAPAVRILRFAESATLEWRFSWPGQVVPTIFKKNWLPAASTCKLRTSSLSRCATIFLASTLAWNTKTRHFYAFWVSSTCTVSNESDDHSCYSVCYCWSVRIIVLHVLVESGFIVRYTVIKCNGNNWVGPQTAMWCVLARIFEMCSWKRFSINSSSVASLSASWPCYNSKAWTAESDQQIKWAMPWLERFFQTEPVTVSE